MRIVENKNYLLYHPNIDIPIGEYVEVDNQLYKCVLGSGHCSMIGEKEYTCAFCHLGECNMSHNLKCASGRKDHRIVSFKKEIE